MPILPVFSVVEMLKEGIKEGIVRLERGLSEAGDEEEKRTEARLRVTRLRAALIGIETVCSLNMATGIVPAVYDSREHDGIIGDYVSLLVDGSLLSH